MTDKLFTVELDSQAEKVEIHLNSKGMEFLIESLQNLKKHKEHEHFMSKEWGGDELTSIIQNQQHGIKLINHLKIFYWEK